MGGLTILLAAWLETQKPRTYPWREMPKLLLLRNITGLSFRYLLGKQEHETSEGGAIRFIKQSFRSQMCLIS